MERGAEERSWRTEKDGEERRCSEGLSPFFFCFLSAFSNQRPDGERASYRGRREFGKKFRMTAMIAPVGRGVGLQSKIKWKTGVKSVVAAKSVNLL
jgi:hypothetical protein